MADTEKDTKYWIKAGCFAEHINCPGLTIVVDHVISEDKILKEGEPSKRFTIGVKCHWLSKEGRYQTGVFHTAELAKPLSLNRV